MFLYDCGEIKTKQFQAPNIAIPKRHFDSVRGASKFFSNVLNFTDGLIPTNDPLTPTFQPSPV